MRTTIFFLTMVTTVAAQRFEPARATSVNVQAIPYRTAAAAIVGVELAVDARGRVADVRSLVDVEPFTDVLRNSARSWSFDAARGGGQKAESHVLVAGVFRPAMLMFPRPDAPKQVDAQPSDDIPFPTSVEVPNYPPNAIGSAYVLVEVEVGESGSVTSTRNDEPDHGLRRCGPAGGPRVDVSSRASGWPRGLGLRLLGLCLPTTRVTLSSTQPDRCFVSG